MTRVCAYCQQVFSPTTDLQVFCSAGHRRKARERRRYNELTYLGLCDKPYKRAFPTPLAAVQFAEGHTRVTNQHPYLCTCACWHLTSRAPFGVTRWNSST